MRFSKVFGVWFILILMVTTCQVSIVSAEETAEPEEFHYIIDNNDTHYFVYIIENGEITITGYNSGNSNDIIIPETIEGLPVTKIGDEAFLNYMSVKNISIPNSVQSIGAWSFGWCLSLEKIDIPSNLISIGDYSFAYSGLKEIFIPEKVSSLGINPFANSPVSEITVSPENEDFAVIDNVLFNKAEKKLISFPVGINETEYAIPNGIICIGDEAFRGSQIEHIIIPESVTAIGRNPFLFCKKLAEFTVDQRNTTFDVDGAALYDINSQTLVSFAPGSEQSELIVLDGITEIGASAISNCPNILNIFIPDSVTRIGELAFANNSNLKDVRLSENINCLESGLFYSCSSLKKITIPENVVLIKKQAFYACGSLDTIIK